MSAIAYADKEGAGRTGRTDPELEDMSPERIQAANRVRALYSSGIPFFTKRAIADLVDQFDRARKHLQHVGTSEGNDGGESRRQMLFLQDLDGKTVELENEIGTVWPTTGTTEHITTDLVIRYRTYQGLIAANTDPRQYTPELAYCPLRINYLECKRDKTTKQLRPQRRGQSLKATREALDAGVKSWESSEECERITAALTASTTLNKVTKVIAFACCTMSRSEAVQKRSITQHALILTIKDILQKKSLTADGHVRCYAQDPIYTSADRAVLEGKGIHVLEDPHGFLEVDDSSIVIAFSPNVPVRQIVADIARPAVMLWNRVKPEGEMASAWSEFWQEQNFQSVEELEANM
ncbi:hypothetical protein SLS63_004858 [Diaporthe eres]|uniref:SRR1-like domain-containing protein n=1 Tax=Diaporthe eres TaxID=83184 RepID=A0ABR1PCF8_DIAER